MKSQFIRHLKSLMQKNYCLSEKNIVAFPEMKL